MSKRWARPFFIVLLLTILFITSGFLSGASQGYGAQEPTENIPTVTGTPGGPMITVRGDTENPQINVRSGPGTEYEKVGILLIGQTAPAKGKTPGGKWIMIEYFGVPGGIGWVYASLVDLTPGALPVVESPPTPTPVMTNTIDPTLAARFVITPLATRMPTFTQPAPLAIPTFRTAMDGRSGGIPMGLVIISLAAVGVFIGLFALAQSR